MKNTTKIKDKIKNSAASEEKATAREGGTLSQPRKKDPVDSVLAIDEEAEDLENMEEDDF